MKSIYSIILICLPLLTFVVSLAVAIVGYSQWKSSELEAVYERMDAYFIAYAKVADSSSNVFSSDKYNNVVNKTELALTTERLLLVIDALNRAGEIDLSNTWYRFLVTMSGPLCDPNVKLGGFAIQHRTEEQLREAKRIACGYD